MAFPERARRDLYDGLEEALGPDRADTLMHLLPQQPADELVTISYFQTEMAAHRGEIRAEMADLRTELKTEMADLRTDLKTEMADLRTDLKSSLDRRFTAMATANVVAVVTALLT